MELLPDPEDPDEELEFIPFVVWGTLEFDEFVSQDDEEFREEFKEEVDVWFEGGGGAIMKIYYIHFINIAFRYYITTIQRYKK